MKPQQPTGDTMTSLRNHGSPGACPRPLRRGLVLATVLLSATACDLDNLLEVDPASRIPADQLDKPASATLLLNGAIADFECAFGSYVVMSGMIGEELMDATQTADRWPYERRAMQASDRRYGEFSCTSLGVYTPLSTARWATENVLAKLKGWTDTEVPNRQSMVATAAAYSGYSHLLLGEGFCSGVLLDENLVPGGEVTREAVLDRAIERFNEAISIATSANNADIRDMARVGLARALLNQGDKAAAGAAAAAVTPNYVKNASASTTFFRRENRVARENGVSQSSSVAPPYRAFQHMGVPDPRVSVTDQNRTATDGTPIFTQNKYPTLTTPIPIATWDEAQLIVAEAQGGATAVGIINAFHARAGLPPSAGGTEAEIQAHLIEERRAELFLESHHLGDIIRYNLPLTPAAGTAYPKGGTYESQLCLPLPNIERLNNPAITG
jgi:hypothetical protein